MSDTIGRGIIEVVADGTRLEAGMEAAKKAVERFEQAAVDSAANAGGALARAGDGAGAAADKLDAATRRYIGSVQREIASVSLSRTEYRLWEAQVKGIGQEVYTPLVQRLLAAKQAQEETARTANAMAQAERQAADAVKELARAQRELQTTRGTPADLTAGMREQIAMLRQRTEEAQRFRDAAQAAPATGGEGQAQVLDRQRVAHEAVTRAVREEAQALRDAAQAQKEAYAQRTSQQQLLDQLREQIALQGRNAEEVLRYRAAQAGIAGEAEPLIRQLQEQRAAQERVTQAARETAQAEREAAQAAANRQRFLDDLREQAALQGKSTDEVLRYRAALAGAGPEAEPLIRQLQEQRVAQEAATKAARDAAQAEKEAAQQRTGQEQLLANLREQIALQGRSTEEVLRYRAAQAGIGAEAEPLIRQLQEQRTAQERLAAAARETAQAEREAAQAAAGRQQFLDSLREQVALQGKNTEEVLRYRAARAGVGEQAAPLILQLQNQKAAQEAATKAAKEEAEAQRAAAQALQGRNNFIESLRSQADAIGKTRSELLEMQAAQMGVTAQAAPFIARLRDAERNIGRVGLSAKETALALRGVPAQLTDIIVSLQGGQAPLTVLLQQGGQLRDMFGSVGDAAKALGGAVGRLLLNPLVLAGTAIAGLALAYNRGSKEGDAFNASIISTGNAVGTTRDALQEMARNIDGVIGTQAQAAEALAALASTGRVASGNLTDFATTAIRVQRTVGTAVEDTVKQFAELGKDPVDASRRLNDETNFLTLAVYEQIKALQEAGRVTEAAALAQRTYAEELDRRTGRITENLGLIERGWRAVKDATQEALDAALAVGRQQGPSGRLADLQAEQQRRQAPFLQRVFGQQYGPGSNLSDQQLRDEIDLIQTGQREARRFAQAEAERVGIQKQAIEASSAVDQVLKSSLSKQQQMNSELEKYRRGLAAIRAANPEDARVQPDSVARGEAAIRERFRERGRTRKPAEYQDDAGTRMLLQARQQETVLREQLSTEERLGAAAKARVEFEQLLADLKEKRTLTAEQKSLVANQDSILAQLRKNELIEDEVKITEERVKIEKAAERERLQFIQRAQQIEETIAQQRESRQEQFDRAFGTLGAGQQAREQVEAQRAIYREAERLQAQLTKATPTALLGSPEYQAEADKIKAALDQALRDQEAYYARLRTAQADWSVGASEALNNYLDSVRDVAGQTASLFERTFSGLEDSLTNFVRTGKSGIKALADQVQGDITRMVVRQQLTGPLADLIQGGMKSGTGVGGYLGNALQGLLGGGNGTPAAGPAGAGLALLTTGATGATTALSLFTAAVSTAATALGATSTTSAVTGAASAAGGGSGIFGTITSFLGSIFGGATGRAVGGPVRPNSLHEVGEDGPELLRWRNRKYLLTGREGGQVEPMSGPSGRPMAVTNHFHLSGPVDRRTQQQIGAVAARSIAVANSRNN